MTRLLFSAAAAFAAICVTLIPQDARACGGFFCSGGQNGPPPVVQTGEKIIFAADGDQVTAQVQILYQGDPREFAWVVPVPSLPTIEVGSDQVFSIFDAATQPTFTLNVTGTCPGRGGGLAFGCGCASPTARYEAGSAAFEEAPNTEVEVISRQPVGPYDTAILSATDPQALQTWLSDNGFDLAPEAEPLIASYVDKGDYFVALKLQSDRSTGDLQPVVLHYTSDEGPCVPIRLTQVAATPDLGIAVFVLGEKRAVPANYLQLEINEAKIDWMNQGINYPQVVTDAANEAGGHGFVTDYAGSNAIVRPQITSALSNYDADAVHAQDPVAFVQAVRAAGFLGTSQNVLAILNRCVPPPLEVNDGGLGWYSAIDNLTQPPTDPVDQPACGDDIDRLVAKPLRDIDALLEKLPTLTRLYTTMSPDEMTVDPIFTFNGDLGARSNVHTISAQQICSGDRTGEFRFTGESGRIFVLPMGDTAEHEPSLAVGYEVHAMGQPIPVVDNRDELATEAELRPEPSQQNDADSGGCAVAPDFSLVTLAGGLLAWRARRRRR